MYEKNDLIMETSPRWMSGRIYFTICIQLIFITSVVSSFTCKGRDTGFYADIENNCRAYHTCDNHGNKFSYNCPLGTAFRQENLVCDHAYLVDCKKSAELIAQESDDSIDETDNFSTALKNVQRFNTYSRSYRIGAQPSVFLVAPKQNDEETTTFVMSSTVFLRDQTESSNLSVKNNENLTNHQLFTTFRPVENNHNGTSGTIDSSNNKKTQDVLGRNFVAAKNNREKFIGTTANSENKRINPYANTLRFMQSKFGNTYISTTPRITTAGTEFPIPNLIGKLAKFNNPDDDPYYPPQQNVVKEPYYAINTKNKYPKSSDFFIRHSWQTKLDLKIPEILPDFNSLEDLVDRRKYLYISKKLKKNI